MSNLNPDQFQGLTGEPDPNTYNRDDDWRRDHQRWHKAKSTGTEYVDRDMAKIEHHRAEEESQVRQEYNTERTVKRQAHGRRMKNLKMVSKGLSALGMKAPSRRRWR